MDNIKIKRWICDILLFLCFTAIAFFAGKILINQWKYKKAQKEYDTLQKAVQTEKSINLSRVPRPYFNMGVGECVLTDTLTFPLIPNILFYCVQTVFTNR